MVHSSTMRRRPGGFTRLVCAVRGKGSRGLYAASCNLVHASSMRRRGWRFTPPTGGVWSAGSRQTYAVSYHNGSRSSNAAVTVAVHTRYVRRPDARFTLTLCGVLAIGSPQASAASSTSARSRGVLRRTCWLTRLPGGVSPCLVHSRRLRRPRYCGSLLYRAAATSTAHSSTVLRLVHWFAHVHCGVLATRLALIPCGVYCTGSRRLPAASVSSVHAMRMRRRI